MRGIMSRHSRDQSYSSNLVYATSFEAIECGCRRKFSRLRILWMMILKRIVFMNETVQEEEVIFLMNVKISLSECNLWYLISMGSWILWFALIDSCL